jgi:hypothetical protein
VEQFTLEVLGAAAGWTEVVPPNVSLFPGTDQTVTVRFSPPRVWSTPAGPVPFAVRVTPSTQPEESSVEEGTVTVSRFDNVTADLVPKLATARITGRQQIAVDSRGNVPMIAALAGTDAGNTLNLRFRPTNIPLEPGKATFARVQVKPRQRFWRGAPKIIPYTIEVAPQDAAPTSVDGTLTQKPLLPKWALPLLLLLAVVALWFLLVKPAIKSTATSAVNTQLAAQQAQTNTLAQQLSSTDSQVKALSGSSTTTTTASTTTTTTAPPTTTTAQGGAGAGAGAGAAASATTTSPQQNALSVTGPGGQTTTSTYTVPTGATLDITDLVFENVSGSNGRVRLQRIPSGANATPQTLLVEDLNTLTDQEYRFGTPIVLSAGQQLVLAVDCTANQPACQVNAFYTGSMTQPK